MGAVDGAAEPFLVDAVVGWEPAADAVLCLLDMRGIGGGGGRGGEGRDKPLHERMGRDVVVVAVLMDHGCGVGVTRSSTCQLIKVEKTTRTEGKPTLFILEKSVVQCFQSIVHPYHCTADSRWS